MDSQRLVVVDADFIVYKRYNNPASVLFRVDFKANSKPAHMYITKKNKTDTKSLFVFLFF